MADGYVAEGFAGKAAGCWAEVQYLGCGFVKGVEDLGSKTKAQRTTSSPREDRGSMVHALEVREIVTTRRVFDK